MGLVLGGTDSDVVKILCNVCLAVQENPLPNKYLQ